jgi:hypothetical protein
MGVSLAQNRGDRERYSDDDYGRRDDRSDNRRDERTNDRRDNRRDNRSDYRDRDSRERGGRYDEDDRDDRYYNYNDRRNDNDRMRDYRAGRYDYRRNPYDSRNLPRNWERHNSRRFDWYSYDLYNPYDPRYNSRFGYDCYFPWDPANPYDIRNRRDYYGSARYWNGRPPARVIIVPPSFNFRWNTGPRYGYGNRGYGRGR